VCGRFKVLGARLYKEVVLEILLVEENPPSTFETENLLGSIEMMTQDDTTTEKNETHNNHKTQCFHQASFNSAAAF